MWQLRRSVPLTGSYDGSEEIVGYDYLFTSESDQSIAD